MQGRGSALPPHMLQSRHALRKVDPDASVVDEHVLHLGVGLLCRRAVLKLDKRILQTVARLGVSRCARTFLSRITSQLRISPKREKMSSRSSLRVTGLSLHTKSTFSGGLMSACGKSPTISSVKAAASAFRRRSMASFSSSCARSRVGSSASAASALSRACFVPSAVRASLPAS